VFLSEPYGIIAGSATNIQRLAVIYRFLDDSFNKIKIWFANIPGCISCFVFFFETILD